MLIVLYKFNCLYNVHIVIKQILSAVAALAIGPEQLRQLVSMEAMLPVLLQEVTSADDDYVWMIVTITKILLPYIDDDVSCVDSCAVVGAMEQLALHPKQVIADAADAILSSLNHYGDEI